MNDQHVMSPEEQAAFLRSLMQGAHIDQNIMYVAPGGVVNYNAASKTAQQENVQQREKRQSADMSAINCLADMIKPEMIGRYKKLFDRDIAPHLASASPSRDPMEVKDMEFEFVRDTYKTAEPYKKGDIYKTFSVMSNYLKDSYTKENLAKYMSEHIAGLPKYDSIQRYI